MTRRQAAAYGDRLSFLDASEGGSWSGWAFSASQHPDWAAMSKTFKFEILAACFAALASPAYASGDARRTLLLVDNAHWLDAPSWELLEYLASTPLQHVGGARLVAVLCKRGTVRPQAPQAWHALAAMPRVRRLELGPLDAVESTTLLCAVLDIPLHAVTPATVDNVGRKCSGVPMLILALCEAIEKATSLEAADEELLEDDQAVGEDRKMKAATQQVVRDALRKVPCFINLDDDVKFDYVAGRRRFFVASGEASTFETSTGPKSLKSAPDESSRAPLDARRGVGARIGPRDARRSPVARRWRRV